MPCRVLPPYNTALCRAIKQFYCYSFTLFVYSNTQELFVRNENIKLLTRITSDSIYESSSSITPLTWWDPKCWNCVARNRGKREKIYNPQNSHSSLYTHRVLSACWLVPSSVRTTPSPPHPPSNHSHHEELEQPEEAGGHRVRLISPIRCVPALNLHYHPGP